MHLTSTATEDSGLAESAYELISGTDSETWSQDGNDISESIGSLVNRPEDVHSLAGTEQMTDDEQDTSLQQAADSDDDESVDNGRPRSVLHRQDHGDDSDASESDDEAHSRSSLDYADQSLETPSILTPEASKLYEKPTSSTATITDPKQHRADAGRGSSREAAQHSTKAEWRALYSQAQQVFVEKIWVITPGFLLVLALCGLPYFFMAPQSSGAQMITTTYTSTVYSTTTTSKAHTPTDAFCKVAHDLSELVPAAAQEAERRIEDAKRSLVSASDTLGNNVLPALDAALKSARHTCDDAYSSWKDSKLEMSNAIKVALFEAAFVSKHAIQDATKKVKEHLPHVQDVQNDLQLGLLDAQISAKIWWLKVTGGEKHSEEYRTKAKVFMAEKQQAAGRMKAARKRQEGEVKVTDRLWSYLFAREQKEPTYHDHW
jgi:hypothetical protein